MLPTCLFAIRCDQKESTNATVRPSGKQHHQWETPTVRVCFKICHDVLWIWFFWNTVQIDHCCIVLYMVKRFTIQSLVLTLLVFREFSINGHIWAPQIIIYTNPRVLLQYFCYTVMNVPCLKPVCFWNCILWHLLLLIFKVVFYFEFGTAIVNIF